VIIRSSKILLVFIATILLGITMLTIVAIWQLNRGPVKLSFLTPYIEDSLSTRENDFTVNLEETYIFWDGRKRTLDLRITGLVILDGGGKVAVNLPELSVQLSLRAMLSGVIAPTQLVLISPSLKVIKTLEEKIFLGVEKMSTDTVSSLNNIDEVAELFKNPETYPFVKYLKRIIISDSQIKVVDNKNMRTFQFEKADITLERDENAIRTHGSFVFKTGSKTNRFDFIGSKSPLDNKIQVGVVFKKLLPTTLINFDQRLGFLNRYNFPLSGLMEFSFSPEFLIQEIAFNIEGGKGSIIVPELYSNPLSVNSLRVKARVNSTFNKINLDEVFIDAGVITVNILGDIIKENDKIRFKIHGDFSRLSVNDISKIWPSSVLANARSWIAENIKGGYLDNTSMVINGTTDIEDFSKVKFQDIFGAFNIHDTKVHYLKPMVPLSHVYGKGVFDSKGIVIDLEKGLIGKLNLSSGRFSISRSSISNPNDLAHIEATITGSTRDALLLLDSNPLKFISPLGIDPYISGGEQNVRMVFDFPLIQDLKIDMVNVAAIAKLKGFSTYIESLGFDFTDGNFDVIVDSKSLVVTGRGSLLGVPLKLKWTENFTNASNLRSRYEAEVVLDEITQQRIGLKPLSFMSGPISTIVNYEISKAGDVNGLISLNLNKTNLSLESFDWYKSAGRSGFANLQIFGKGGLKEKNIKFSVNAPGLLAEGQALVIINTNNIQLSKFNINNFNMDKSNFSLRGVYDKSGVANIFISGESLDLRSIVQGVFKDKNKNQIPFRLNISKEKKLKNILLGKQTVLLNSEGSLTHDGSKWTNIDITGVLSNGGPIELKMRTVNGTSRVEVKTNDGGGLLNALDWTNTIEGGSLQLNGKYIDEEEDNIFFGEVSLEDFKLVGSSIGVRILSLASFSGISDAITGTGISMRKAIVPFEMTNGAIKILTSKAQGAGVGVIADGLINRNSKHIELKGEVAPAYLINSILGNIPVLGEIIGDGIIALSFSVRGPIKNPGISVNPLTVFAPGVFRKAFTGFNNRNLIKQNPILE